MDIISIIEKKKKSEVLTREEINFFIDGVCNGGVKNYQAVALLMAICFNKMTFEETFDLTMAMANSGQVLNLDDIGICVDKHSTGGVSDTTTLVIAPIISSLGVKFAKMSGRSLGFTGGTADKMEVFKGCKVNLSTQKFKNLIVKNNASIITQSSSFAFADKILYALRSLSATVENESLIASSIMSKKIACGAKILLLDVKFGSGAFMKTKEEAENLANIMVKIGKKAGIKTEAIISNMNQPLTEYVGNNFEVQSAIDVLCGKENMLSELSFLMCEEILMLTGVCKSKTKARNLIKESIASGKAKNQLKKIIHSQGGNTAVIDNPSKLHSMQNKIEVLSDRSGFINEIRTSDIGNICNKLQVFKGKFSKQNDVGIILNKQLGDKTNKDDILAFIFVKQCDNLNDLKDELKECFKISSKKQEIDKLVYKIVKE